MNPADLAIAALFAVGAALAWHRGARPLALTLTWGLTSHLALRGMDAWLPHYPGPYTGARAWWQRGEIALRVAWPGAIVWCVWATKGKRR